MARAHRIWRAQVVLWGVLLALAGCAAGATPPMATGTTPTLAPVACGPHYGRAYQATLPDASFAQTMVYARVPLPPQTRSYDDDATGLLGRRMCSAGTTASVAAFMTAHLSNLGWQSIAPLSACGIAVISGYGQPQCWQQGKYALFMGINSHADWILAFVDPAFLR